MAAKKRYDWDTLADGKYHLLRESDVRGRLDNVRAYMHREAKARDLWVRTSIMRPGGDAWFAFDDAVIVFRFTSLEDSDFELFDALAELREHVRPHFVELLERTGKIPAAS